MTTPELERLRSLATDLAPDPEILDDGTECHRAFTFHEDDLRAAVNQLIEEVERLRGELASADRWILRDRNDSHADHACLECRPHSDILVDGFLCSYHKAAIRAAAEGPREVTEELPALENRS